MTRRICVVTAGHLSTSPRMLKAADALHDAGYAVRVVCTNHVPWAATTDVDVRRTRVWPVTVVDYDRGSAPVRHGWSGIRSHAARAVARMAAPSRMPVALAVRAVGRVHPELVRAVLAEPADLIYGGTASGIAVAAEAARRARVPYALDLEDFYRASHVPSPTGILFDGLLGRIERHVLPGAAFLTAAGATIASAYAGTYGVQPIPVNNVFPLPPHPPENLAQPRPQSGLRLYWFSQTIGPGRGIEDTVRAMGMADLPGELHLRGNRIPEFIDSLGRLAAQVAPRLRLVCHSPAAPDTMISLALNYDIGLTLEQNVPRNRSLCLTNKVFTYMLAGLAVLCTDTPGQRPIAEALGEGARLAAPGDIAALAAALTEWAADGAALARARQASWAAAQRRWHWEHPLERGALLAAVERVFA